MAAQRPQAGLLGRIWCCGMGNNYCGHCDGGGDQAMTKAEMAERIADLERTFDLRWEADRRAIMRWQKAHPGNDLIWPDHADLVVWLLRTLDYEAPGWDQRIMILPVEC